MKLHLIAFVLAAFILNSCGTTKDTDSTQKAPAMDNADIVFTKIPTETFWKLETLEGKDFSSFKNNGNEVGFTLFADNHRISGYAGCNNFFATYKMEPGNRINFSEIGATKMLCSDTEFNENDFLKIFQLADNYTITGNRLELNVGKRAPLAVFTKSGTSAEPIVEKYWKLKTLEGKKVKMDKNQAREIYFTLNTSENRVTGFAGCNTIMGTYTLEEGNRIHFSQMATTMMACPDIDFNESEFLKVFELADNYRITGDQLELNVGRRAPLAVFEAVYFD